MWIADKWKDYEIIDSSCAETHTYRHKNQFTPEFPSANEMQEILELFLPKLASKKLLNRSFHGLLIVIFDY